MNDPQAFVRNYDKPAEEVGTDTLNWRVEYERVLTGHRVLLDRTNSSIKRYEDVALCVISTPDP
jgi:hypothetical protein